MTNENTQAPERFLLEKHGLYYRPNDKGYTGIKDEAGRYTLDQIAVRFPNMDSPNQDGITFISEDEAPLFSKACWDETKIAYWKGKCDLHQAELAAVIQKASDAVKIARQALQGLYDPYDAMAVLNDTLETLKREVK